mmetsp:Transcript_26435/g.36906  ORF Transcript_26435/g.36906 Transcript_26435/m.36906 type:complete len:243 (-) Transcript_26435:236-964(-)
MLHSSVPRPQRGNSRYHAVLLAAGTIALLCAASVSVSSQNALSRNISRRNVIKSSPLAWATSTAALTLIKKNAAAADLSVTKYDTVSLFGRIATSSCYGKIANRATCQIDGENLMGRLLKGSSSISKEQLKENIRDLQFEWPLKPYGQEKENKVKTVILNKPAELSEWKEAARRKNLGDPFYLNASGREKLNKAISTEELTDDAVDALFKILSSDGKSIRADDISRLSGMDWYAFSDLLGSP